MPADPTPAQVEAEMEGAKECLKHHHFRWPGHHTSAIQFVAEFAARRVQEAKAEERERLVRKVDAVMDTHGSCRQRIATALRQESPK